MEQNASFVRRPKFRTKFLLSFSSLAFSKIAWLGATYCGFLKTNRVSSFLI